MSAPRLKAKEWTCDQCGVAVSQIDGSATPLPFEWAKSTEGQFCLLCRRDRAGNEALESAPDNTSVEARAKLRRGALLEFEVTRTPDRTDGAIAKACRSSVTAVAQARQRLHLPEPVLTPKNARANRREPVSR